MNDIFTEIWNKAYNIFTDGSRTESGCYNDMQRYLMDQVKAGRISLADKCHMAAAIMECAGL